MNMGDQFLKFVWNGKGMEDINVKYNCSIDWDDLQTRKKPVSFVILSYTFEQTYFTP